MLKCAKQMSSNQSLLRLQSRVYNKTLKNYIIDSPFKFAIEPNDLNY